MLFSIKKLSVSLGLFSALALQSFGAEGWSCLCPQDDLGCAVSVNCADQVREILGNGGDPDAPYSGECEWTPLYHATLVGHQQIVEMLLVLGANPQETCCVSKAARLFESPLGYALSSGKYHLVDLFVAYGLDLEPVLAGAVSVGDLDTVRALHDYGVDVTAPYSDGFLGSPLAHARSLAEGLTKHGIYGHAMVAAFLEGLIEGRES